MGEIGVRAAAGGSRVMVSLALGEWKCSCVCVCVCVKNGMHGEYDTRIDIGSHPCILNQVGGLHKGCR
jgi:hypothetical protein